MAMLDTVRDTIDAKRDPSAAERAIYGCVPGAAAWDRAKYDADKAAELIRSKETGEPVFWSQGFDFAVNGDSVLVFVDGHPVGLIDVDYFEGSDFYFGPAESAVRVNQEPLALDSVFELANAVAHGEDLSRWVDA